MSGRAQYQTYGSRGSLRGVDAGVRRVAPTFGKTHISLHRDKAGGHFSVESRAERFIADVLTLDPRVSSFRCQPFTVDLIDRRILRTGEERSDARKRHKGMPSPHFYTPDFLAQRVGDTDLVVEVKSEHFVSDDDSDERLSRAQQLLLAMGYKFLRVVVPDDPALPLRVNLGVLSLAASRSDLRPSRDQANALAQACGDGSRSLGEICRSLGLPASQTPGWIVSGVFAADVLRQPINFDMRVTCAYGDLSHLTLIEEFAA